MATNPPSHSHSAPPALKMAFRARASPATLRRRVRAPTIPRAPLARLALPAPAVAGPGPATLLARGLHSSPPRASLRSFLGFKDATPADVLVDAAANRARDLPAKWKMYADTLALPSSRRLTAAESLAILQALDALRGPRGVPPPPLFSVARRCYEAIPAAERTAAHHTAAVRVLTALALAEARELAVSIASQHPAAMGREEWDMLLRTRYDVGRVLEAAPADDHTFYVLLEGADTADLIAEAKALMAAHAVPPGPWTQVALARAYAEAGLDRDADAIAASWPEEADADGELAQARWRVRVARAVKRRDAATVRGLASPANARGEVPADALAFLVLDELPIAPTVADILGGISRTADQLGCLIPPAAWDQVLITLFERGTDLVTVWEANGQRYSAPGEALAALLIEQLTTLEPPLFHEALQVYTDATTSDDAPVMRPQVYRALLEAALAVEPTEEVREAVFSHILVDMAVTQQRLQATFATSLVQRLWKHFATDHPDACGMYDAVLSAAFPLDGKQWEFLLLRFIDLSFPHSTVPTPELLVRMLGDMRAAGFRPSSRILTSLLWSYADMAKATKKYEARGAAAVHSELLAATRNVQALLSLDAALDVDLRLLTALMCSLQCCGAFDDAFDVWAEIVRLHKNYPAKQMGAAISVMLDACGHAGMLERGIKVWAWACRRGFVNDEKDWAAYIEMLARNRRFHDAVDAVAEMKAELPPTFEVVVTPLRFARGTPHLKTVRRRLTELFPEWEDRLLGATSRPVP